MPTGTVKWFDRQKGYGFLRVDEARRSDPDIFVHYSAIEMQGYKTLEDGAKVEFDIEDTERGPQARNVIIPATTSTRSSSDDDDDQDDDDFPAGW